MPNELNKTLDAIGTELAGLLSVEDINPQSQTMTLDQFVAYCAEQIKLAKADANPTPRLAALSQIVALAKAYSWEDGAAMSVPLFSGELAVTSQSAYAERNPTAIDSEMNGQGFSVPGLQAAPAGGAFETSSAGPSGPPSNTAKPAARYMPPAFPQSEPAAAAQGFMAKAASILEKSAEGKTLLAEFNALLGNEPAQPGDGDGFKKAVSKDDGWPHDLATDTFLNGKPAVANEDDFGTDPNGLGRGKPVA